MGSSAQLYNLGWNDFDSSLKGAVQGLRARGDLTDVTLAAGGKTYPAHKLVLSAASSLFLELLKVTPCQHPVILLAGIGVKELEQVLDFVYGGQVNVHPSELSALLQAAHILDIQGLIQGSITSEKPEDQTAAEAALAASSESGKEINASCYAASTKLDLLKTANYGSSTSSCKRKLTLNNCECNDSLPDKWGKYDSNDDSLETDVQFKHAHKVTTNTVPIQTNAISSNINQTVQHIVKHNVPDCGLKNQRHPDQQGTMSNLHPVIGGNQTSSLPVQSGSVCRGVDESTVLPHHLDINEDDVNEEESYADIVAAADAAALVASTLADKKGVSDQPAACPLCNAIIRQSRNLRRHLELKHFGKRPKKGKGGKRKTRSSSCDSDTESNAGSVADTTVIEHVQVEMKSPSVCDTILSSVPISASSSPTQTPPSKHHTLTELLPAHQHHNVEAYLHQQQLQQLDSFHHMVPPSASNAPYQIPYPHPHPHLSMLRGDPHATILGGESLTFRSASQQQIPATFNASSRSTDPQ